MIRKARIEDAKEIQNLINHYATANLMLPRSLNEIYDNIRDFYVAESDGKVIGCAALHISWEDLAEIKSLAVDEGSQKKGLGKKLVEKCLKEANDIGVKKIFALTLVTDFFKKLGFKPINKKKLPQKIFNKKKLPQKIWTECINCIKFTECDEIALVYEVDGSGKE
jgi:amino-acid N-acetyltransferase